MVKEKKQIPRIVCVCVCLCVCVSLCASVSFSHVRHVVAFVFVLVEFYLLIVHMTARGVRAGVIVAVS